MLSIQRSIPIPRIGLDKLVNYIVTVGENPGINCSVIKEKGLDIGKGKGDITRFFMRINVVQVKDNCAIFLTEIGEKVYRALINDVSLGKSMLHLVLYNELPHYKLLIDLIANEGEVSLNELFQRLNEKVHSISPTAWVNEVAFKTLIGLARDLDVIDVSNGKVSLRYTASVSECLRNASVSLDGQEIIKVSELKACLGSIIKDVNMDAFMTEIKDCVEPIVAPGINPKSSYFKIINKDCVIKALLNALLK